MRALVLTLLMSLSALGHASESIEAVLTAMQGEKKGVTLYVQGQQIGGAVVKLEPGKTVELRGPGGQRIVVRLDRVDAVALYP
ncbi:hypothetical protein [Inhella sp.]|uniref:hypothetical protein n=1 Tax=Inhella sp. TaxID=1921806 RepID=UPI0035B4475B